MSGTEAGWNNSYAALGDMLWFGTNSGRIYRSSDRGQTWASGLTPSLNCFSISFADSERGLATFSASATTGGTELIARTTDGGATWRPATMPFAGTEPQSVTFVPGTTRAFIGTQNGVFETSDFGVTWKRMAMPVMAFTGLLLSAQSDSAGNVGAYGTNSYSQLMNYQEAGTVVSSVGTERTQRRTTVARIHPILPSPTTDAAMIRFDLGIASDITLTLRDAQGRLLRTIAAGRMNAGTHSIRLDVDDLAAGMYFCVLEAAGESVMERLVVVK
jgi:hypothetical protein